MLPWWEMRDVLLNKVRDLATASGEAGVVDLITGRTFTSIVDDGTSVTVTLGDRGEGNEEPIMIEADFLVGCDGVHSSVRKWLGLPDAVLAGGTMFRGSIIVGEDQSEDLRAVLKGGIVPVTVTGVQGFFCLVFNFNEKSPGRLAWMVSTTNDITDDTTPLTLLEDVDIKSEEKRCLLFEIFRSSEEHHLKPYLPTKVLDFSDEYLSGLEGRWGGRGLVTLLGDAAHAMRPTDGQGGNMAFEDVVVLFREIVKKISTHELLGEFERKRLPRVSKVHHSQRERYEERMRGGAAKPLPHDFREWLLAGV